LLRRYATGASWGGALVGICIMGCIPLFIAREVAAASSDCDAMHVMLNAKREAGCSNEDHLTLTKLETTLDRCNMKQVRG
jgi:hypothetical protein